MIEGYQFRFPMHPDQIVGLSGIKINQRYTKIDESIKSPSGQPYTETFTVVGEPFQESDGSTWMIVTRETLERNLKVRRSGPIKESLSGCGALPYQDGHWNQDTYLVSADEAERRDAEHNGQILQRLVRETNFQPKIVSKSVSANTIRLNRA